MAPYTGGPVFRSDAAPIVPPRRQRPICVHRCSSVAKNPPSVLSVSSVAKLPGLIFAPLRRETPPPSPSEPSSMDLNQALDSPMLWLWRPAGLRGT